MTENALLCNDLSISSVGAVKILSRRGTAPSTMSFSSAERLPLGGIVSFGSTKEAVFKGRIFSASFDGTFYSYTAYDLLRYFENEDTRVYENKTASEMLHLICLYCGFPIGNICDTRLKIPSVLYDTRSFSRIMESALVLTSSAGFGEYVLFDDCGKISLLPSDRIASGTVIFPSECSEFTAVESIDEDFYTFVRLSEPTDDGRIYHTERNAEAEEKYGKLVFSGTLTPNENGSIVAKNLLDTFSSPKLTVKCTSVCDIPMIRGGAAVGVFSDGGIRRMVCESAERIYSGGGIKMKLVLSSL